MTEVYLNLTRAMRTEKKGQADRWVRSGDYVVHDSDTSRIPRILPHEVSNGVVYRLDGDDGRVEIGFGLNMDDVVLMNSQECNQVDFSVGMISRRKLLGIHPHCADALPGTRAAEIMAKIGPLAKV